MRAIMVFPAPVGAQMRRFSLDRNAVSNSFDWIRLRWVTPAKASWAQSSNSAMGTRRSPAGTGVRTAGMYTSS